MSKIKVRIAVAVDPSGCWKAVGFTSATGDFAMECAVEGISEGEARYWLEAELDVPEPKVIAATVIPGPTHWMPLLAPPTDSQQEGK